MPSSGIAFLSKLGIRAPIILAPMGGGPGTPALAAAVSNAGGLGSIAAAYLTPEAIIQETGKTRVLTNGPININLFAGGYEAENGHDAAPMLEVMAGVHRLLRIPPPIRPSSPRNPFGDQVAAVLDLRPAVFSFTFGIPPAKTLSELREAGILLLGTATSVEEATRLRDAGVDGIVAQGAEAGAHRGSFATPFDEAMIPTLALVHEIASSIGVPVIASGGIMTGVEIADALERGAAAVQLGTAFLACPEAGTSPAYRQALLHARGEDTVVTRAFSGRPARGIRNRFTDLLGERNDILPFPIQNTLTRAMRAASAEANNADYLSLWAGTGVAKIRTMPAATLMSTLLQELELSPLVKSLNASDSNSSE